MIFAIFSVLYYGYLMDMVWISFGPIRIHPNVWIHSSASRYEFECGCKGTKNNRNMQISEGRKCHLYEKCAEAGEGRTA